MGYEYEEEFEEEEAIEEEVVFLHELQALEHKEKRKADRLFKKAAKNMKNHALLTDKQFAKRRLHKANRRREDVTSYSYYKNGLDIASIEYGLT